MNYQDKILVTGGRGLVGSAVVRRLQKEGYTTNILHPTSKELNLLNYNECLWYFNEFCPKYVIHCAGAVAGIIGNDKNNFYQLMLNAKMALNIIEVCHKFRVEKMLFLGSTCIYPRDTEQPIKEESLLTSSLESTNEGYALAKILGVKACEYLNKEHKLNFISAMPTNVYGPNDKYDPFRSHVLPALIRKVHEAKLNNTKVKIGGDGTPVRQFIYSDDLADAIIFLMENYNEPETINIASNEHLTIRELALKIGKVIGFEGGFEYDNSIPNGTPIKIADTSKLTKLGWTSKINLDEGIKLTYEDFLRKLKVNYV